MFNNLGLYGGLGFTRVVIHTIRKEPLRKLSPVVRRAPVGLAVANFGGSGNDIINIGGSVGPIGPPGPPGPPGGPGTIGLVPVTLVTTTPFTPTLSDYLLNVNVAGPSSIVLPVSPIGTVFIIKDISGAAFTNPITVTATAGTIDGTAIAVINVPFASLTVVYNGIQWIIL